MTSEDPKTKIISHTNDSESQSTIVSELVNMTMRRIGLVNSFTACSDVTPISVISGVIDNCKQVIIRDNPYKQVGQYTLSGS